MKMKNKLKHEAFCFCKVAAEMELVFVVNCGYFIIDKADRSNVARSALCTVHCAPCTAHRAPVSAVSNG
jgi:hypothetical protein